MHSTTEILGDVGVRRVGEVERLGVFFGRGHFPAFGFCGFFAACFPPSFAAAGAARGPHGPGITGFCSSVNRGVENFAMCFSSPWRRSA